MRVGRFFPKLLAFATLAAMSGCAGVAKQFVDEPELIEGEGTTINGHEVKVYAFRQDGVITHLGVIVPYPLIENPPTNGNGPAGAFASLEFPEEVKRETFFDHIDVRWEPNGHLPPALQQPMFDIRAFGISKAEAAQIAGTDTRPPDANRVPPEYVYQGVNNVVPNLGVRAMRPDDLQSPFVKAMALAYWHNELVALEAMVTKKRLNKTEMEIFVPQPEVLGRAVRYPTHFRAVYDAERNAYGFVFEDFVNFAR